MGRFWSLFMLKKAGERDGERGSRVDRAVVARTDASSSLVALPILGFEWAVPRIIFEQGGINNMEEVKKDWGLPETAGEPRLTRKRWPKNCSPVFVSIVFEGLVFTVARAQVSISRKDGLDFHMAEGISRLSPLDDPKKRNEIQGREMAISQAIRALHTRVMRHRRSFHHYRG